MDILRKSYLNQIRPFYDVDIIKVLTGVRRAGKSTLIGFIIKEIKEKGIDDSHIIYINLDDMDFDYINSYKDLYEDIKSKIIDENKYYIFIDEIQHIEKFEKALVSLFSTKKVSIFITGSDSSLLSGEIATLLTGRTIEFEIFPFSYSEAIEYAKVNDIKVSDDFFLDYLKWGGFPLRYKVDKDEDKLRYLKNLYDGIINRDIICKNSKIEKKQFNDITMYILANAGNEFSIQNIIDYYKKENKKSISRNTIVSYIEMLKKAFLITPVKKYNINGKKILKNDDKYYAIDNGFRIISTNTYQYQITFFLENIIFNELRRRNYQVYVGKTYNSEVDFIAIKNNEKYFIQVAYLLAEESTIEREFGAFKSIREAYNKYVLSLDKIDMSRDGIRHINIEYFLENENILI